MNQDYVQSVFETVAPDYDRMNWLISLGLHHFWRAKAVEKLGIQSGASILDLCCGACNWTVKLARAVGPSGEVVGVDFSPRMLERGRAKRDRFDLEQVSLKQGNALDLPFPADRFDYVAIGFGLRNVIELRPTLTEMKRVVKPQGTVASLDLSKPIYPGYRALFFFYLFKVVPWLGGLVTDNYKEYAWLPESLANFPDSKELAEIFDQLGFNRVQTDLFAGGAVALHQGQK